MDVDHEHPFQSRRLDDFENLGPRRRAAAASGSFAAANLERLRRAGHDLGVPFPRHITPTSIRHWTEALERANGTEEVR